MKIVYEFHPNEEAAVIIKKNLLFENLEVMKASAPGLIAITQDFQNMLVKASEEASKIVGGRDRAMACAVALQHNTNLGMLVTTGGRAYILEDDVDALKARVAELEARIPELELDLQIQSGLATKRGERIKQLESTLNP
jgi:hypothetical protein